MNNYFLHQVKRTNGNFDKGIVVKDSFEAAKQGYHAYMGAYAYGHDANTDMVQSLITDSYGTVMEPFNESWVATEVEAQV